MPHALLSISHLGQCCLQLTVHWLLWPTFKLGGSVRQHRQYTKTTGNSACYVGGGQLNSMDSGGHMSSYMESVGHMDQRFRVACANKGIELCIL